MTVRKNWGQRKLPADLEAELDKVRKAAPPPPIEDPIYEYLKRVYRLRRKVASSPDLQEALKDLHKKHHPRTLQQYAAVIIELTAGGRVSRNRKNKYVTALNYAYREGVAPKDLIGFVQKNGGLNKCGDLFRKKHRQRTSSSNDRKKSKE